MAALVDALAEPAEPADPAGLAGWAGSAGSTLHDQLERLPVSLALSAALFLARAANEPGVQIAACIYDQLRPLAGQELRLDDDLARLALALGRPAEAVAL